jgi:hypothetical protein
VRTVKQKGPAASQALFNFVLALKSTWAFAPADVLAGKKVTHERFLSGTFGALTKGAAMLMCAFTVN